MKGDKKILALSILVLLLAVCFGSYAIYKSSGSGSSGVEAAKWIIKVNNDDIVTNDTFDLDDVTWSGTRYGQNGKIAPGDRGTIDIVIDASGSEVGVSYKVDLSEVDTGNPNLKVEAASGSSLTGTIDYGTTMTKTITLDVVWNGEDTAQANSDDIATAGTSINIPVTVTVTQNPNPAA